MYVTVRGTPTDQPPSSGAAVGGAADANANRTGTVIVEQPAAPTTQRTCVRDSAGNETCQQVTR